MGSRCERMVIGDYSKLHRFRDDLCKYCDNQRREPGVKWCKNCEDGAKAGLNRSWEGYLNRRVRDLDDEEPDKDLVDDIRDAEERGLDIDHALW